MRTIKNAEWDALYATPEGWYKNLVYVVDGPDDDPVGNCSLEPNELHEAAELLWDMRVLREDRRAPSLLDSRR